VRSIDPQAAPSVHMCPWPEADASLEDDALLFEIAVVQKVVGLGRAARGLSGVRTRQPLSRLLVRAPDDAAAAALAGHREQILEELNVKSIEFIARDAGLVSYRIKPNLPRIGKRFGKRIPAIKQALLDADGAAIAGAVSRGEYFELRVAGETLTLGADDVLVETSSAEGFACAEDGGYLAALDTALNDDLRREGIARELVRTVQDARKQAGLEVSDRIVLGVSGTAAVEEALAQYREYLMQETLAREWAIGRPDALYRGEREFDGQRWTIEIAKLA